MIPNRTRQRTQPSSVFTCRQSRLIDGRQNGQEQVFCEAELLLVLISKATWAQPLCKRRIISFIDNDSARLLPSSRATQGSWPRRNLSPTFRMARHVSTLKRSRGWEVFAPSPLSATLSLCGVARGRATSETVTDSSTNLSEKKICEFATRRALRSCPHHLLADGHGTLVVSALGCPFHVAPCTCDMDTLIPTRNTDVTSRQCLF